jgi:hypothetical protein
MTLREGLFERILVTATGTVLLTRGGDIHRSEDQGQTWTILPDALPDSPSAFTETADGALFVAVRDSVVTLLRSTDDGQTWMPIHALERTPEYPIALGTDTHGRLYMVHNRRVYRLTEEAGTWKADEFEHTPLFLSNLVIDEYDALYTLVENTGALLRSDDGGASWVELGRALEGYDPGLLVYGTDGFLYAATQRDGVFRSQELFPTALEEGPVVPSTYLRAATYPNPFGIQATISFSLARPARVTLTVYDVLGRHVATLLDGERAQAGSHEVPWDATGQASGVYLYRLLADGHVRAGRMLLLR